MPSFHNLFLDVESNNIWFEKSQVECAILALGDMLDANKLNSFICHYKMTHNIKRVGVVVASNIPLVGFYDFFCVLLSGHIFVGKLSKSNNILLPFVADLLFNIKSVKSMVG